MGLIAVALVGGVLAQAAPDAPVASKAPGPEEQAYADVVKSNHQLREQLYQTQLAIANFRIEAEAASRAQAASVNDKLETMKRSIEAERERQKQEADRAAAERERQHRESQRTINTILWTVFVFALVGLAAVLAGPYFQWRAVKELVVEAAARPALPTAATAPLLAGASPVAADQAVAGSSQRLLSAIDRMEQRILDLEQTTTTAVTPPTRSEVPAAAASVTPFPSQQRRPDGVQEDPWIVVLLRKGQSLMRAQKPFEALGCYDEILKIQPSHTEALVKRGAALEQMGQDEEALECYNEAIRIDSRMTLAYLHKGGLCNRLERYDEALVSYQQAMRAEEPDRKTAFQ